MAHPGGHGGKVGSLRISEHSPMLYQLGLIARKTTASIFTFLYFCDEPHHTLAQPTIMQMLFTSYATIGTMI
jgi:hypothetical protein